MGNVGEPVNMPRKPVLVFIFFVGCMALLTATPGRNIGGVGENRNSGGVYAFDTLHSCLAPRGRITCAQVVQGTKKNIPRRRSKGQTHENSGSSRKLYKKHKKK